MSLITQVLPLAVAGCLAVALCSLISKYPLMGFLGIAAFCIVASDYPDLPPIATFGSLSLHPEDAFCALLAASAFFHRPYRDPISPSSALSTWILPVGLIVLSIARGLSDFGLATAVNEARPTLYVIVTGWWCWRFRETLASQEFLDKALGLLGASLVVVALLHIATRGVGDAELRVLQDGELVTSRPLVAGQAFVLLLISIYEMIRKRWWLAVSFILIVGICQHRSVWAAAAAALLVLLIFGTPKQRQSLLLATLLAGVAGFAYLTSRSGSELLGKLTASATDTATWQGRQSDYAYLTAQLVRQGKFSVLFGQPFGTGYVRPGGPEGTSLTYPPHDWYVLLFLRIGLVGVALGVICVVRCLRSRVRRRDTLSIVWAAAFAVYLVAYNFPWYASSMFAVALYGPFRAAIPVASSPVAGEGPGQHERFVTGART